MNVATGSFKKAGELFRDQCFNATSIPAMVPYPSSCAQGAGSDVLILLILLKSSENSELGS